MSHARKSSLFYESFDFNKVVLRYQFSKEVFYSKTTAILYCVGISNICFILEIHSMNYNVWYKYLFLISLLITKCWWVQFNSCQMFI